MPKKNKQSIAQRADFLVENHGSIFTFLPVSAAAREWLIEHTDGTWLGSALAVEHRYAFDLAQGMQEEGFSVQQAPIAP